MKASYPRNISIIASIFIFLILFLALVNFIINIQLRNEFFAYDKNRTVSIATLCAHYLERYSGENELYFLLRNVSSSFNLEHLIISDTLGNKIFDSWSHPLEIKLQNKKIDYITEFKALPKANEVIQHSNNFIYHNTSPTFYLYMSLSPAYSVIFDRIFIWHIFYITISLLFVGFLGLFLIRNLFLPMRYVANVAKNLGVELKKEDFVSETFDEIFGKLKAREEMLVEFSSYIAHEFRNSIAAIIGLARLVEKGKKPALDIIKECRTMEDLITRLLEYSRPMKPMLSSVDIGQVIDDGLSRIALPDRINLTKRIPDHLPRIKADYDLLSAAIINILKNGLEAVAHKGAIHIEAGIEDDYLFIEISDTGAGIDNEDLNKIFSPFYSKKEMGMGLGLAYVWKIMELHNGKVEVESKKGTGSKFTLKFLYEK
jgi:signal transduction histidine kinase